MADSRIKYHEGVHAIVMEMMGKKGDSLLDVCKHLDVDRETFRRWMIKYPELRVTYNKAKEQCEAYWQNFLRERLDSRTANAQLIKYYMANRFGWSDNVTNEHKITVNDTTQNLRQIHDEYYSES